MVAGHAMVNGCGRWARSRAVVRRVVGLHLVLLSTTVTSYLLLPHLSICLTVDACDYLRSPSLQPACALIQLCCGRKAQPVHSTSQRVRFAGVQHRVDEFKDEQGRAVQDTSRAGRW